MSGDLNLSPKSIVQGDAFAFPMSFAQQRLWFLNQLEPDSPAYNIPAAYRPHGSLDISALERSLRQVVERHETLRTKFQSVDGEPAQIVVPSLECKLSLIDLSKSSDAEVLRWFDDEAERPFDLSSGPLFRFSLLRRSQAEHVFFLNFHHIIFDGWSMPIFFRELAAAYEAHSHGASVVFPELPIQYADFVLWQREWLQSPAFQSQLCYWHDRLSGIETLNLPVDHFRSASPATDGARERITIAPELAVRLKALSRQQGATLFMTLLAAFQTLLHRYTGQDDIVVGTPIAGRDCRETEGLVGFFVNMIVLRTDLSNNPTFTQLLKRVRQISLEAYDRQDLPFEMLVQELNPDRSLNQNPLFRTIFSLQSEETFDFQLPGVTARRLELASRTAKFDLGLSVTEVGSALNSSISYRTSMFSAETIRRWLQHYHAVLEAIVTDPDRCIGDLPMLTAAERHQLLVEWNDTRRDYPSDQCIHRLFEAQVERTPDALAVVFDARQLTYRELNERANRLARHLKYFGVGADVLVAISMERSVE
ncbi:MAG: AMP-binding protein, partial [Deltaproteobacteria bacterium]|nr:AMP-binding protein [Deltaproteobacteria bacterium]